MVRNQNYYLVIGIVQNVVLSTSPETLSVNNVVPRGRTVTGNVLHVDIVILRRIPHASNVKAPNPQTQLKNHYLNAPDLQNREIGLVPNAENLILLVEQNVIVVARLVVIGSAVVGQGILPEELSALVAKRPNPHQDLLNI